MENTNEGTVTISLQRYKELEGYEKDSLNLIAEVVAPYEAKVEDLKKDLERSENRYKTVKDLLDEYEPLIIDGSKTIREAILANEEKSNAFRKEMIEKNTKLREEFENEKDILLSKHEGVVRLQREEIESAEKYTKSVAVVTALISIAVGFIFGMIVGFNLK